MSQHVIIDGNNLLHAMHAHAPIPHVGRETLVRVIERWGRGHDGRITLVFDGPTPRGGLSGQMKSKRLRVRFSAPASADDVIVGMVHQATRPAEIRVVTSDNAIRHEARARKCLHSSAKEFVEELVSPGQVDSAPAASAETSEKPSGVTPAEAEQWAELFGMDDDDQPFDGHEAMR